MFIRSKIARVPSPWPGRTLFAARELMKMDRATAARVLEISVVRLYLLENGEADMEDPAMWDEANRLIREAKFVDEARLLLAEVDGTPSARSSREASMSPPTENYAPKLLTDDDSDAPR